MVLTPMILMFQFSKGSSDMHKSCLNGSIKMLMGNDVLNASYKLTHLPLVEMKNQENVEKVRLLQITCHKIILEVKKVN